MVHDEKTTVELVDFHGATTVASAPWLALANALAETTVAELQALAAYLQALPTTCPAAFDADGTLRENWVEVVQAQIAGAQPAPQGPADVAP